MKIKIGSKKENKNKTAIILNLILDASYSMFGKRKAVIDGFNEYVQTVKKQNPESNFVTNVLVFNDEVKHLFSGVQLEEIPEMDSSMYVPRGSTSLYDAIGEAIYQADSQRRLLGDSTVLTFIFTDGEENSSSKFKGDAIKSLINDHEKTGDWTFTFIGADKNCLSKAIHDIGINLGNAIQADPANFSISCMNLAAATGIYTSNVYNGLRSTNCFYKDAGIDNAVNLDLQTTPAQVVITTSTNKS